MKGELFEFVLEQSGVIPDIPHFHMIAPKGAKVINPSIPWYERHVAEIKQRFPKSSYSRYPELTRGNAFRYWAVTRAYRSGQMFGSAVTLVPAIAIVTAGAVSGAIVGEQLGKRSKPGATDMYTPSIRKYESSAFGSSRMI